MDYRRIGLLTHFVLVLMLLEVQCRPVFPTPIELTQLLILEAKELLDVYLTHHGVGVKGTKVGVPSSEISGNNTCQKLQDVYIKNVLFNWHIDKVQKYDVALSETISGPLSRVKGNLCNHSARIKNLLNGSVPATAAPPQLSHNDHFTIRQYGWAVIDSLKEWLERVQQVLKEAEKDATLCEV